MQRKIDIDELEGCFVVFVFGKGNAGDYVLNRNSVVCGVSSLFQEHIEVLVLFCWAIN